MNNYRKNAIAAGSFLLAAIVLGVIGMILTIDITPENILTIDTIQINKLAMGSALFILMTFACAGIAFSLYPILKTKNPALAIAVVGFRVIEAACIIASATSRLKIVSLVKNAQSALPSQTALYQFTAEQYFIEADWIGAVGGTLAFCFGALIYYCIFTQSNLIPRWISIWGIIAILTHIVSVILIIFGADSWSNFDLVLNLPIFLNELILGSWLIFKGFNKEAIS